MAVNLSPVGGVAAQFFTNSGVPLTGGKLYTYAAGTTTPQAAYTTSQGNVPWTNPIVLDAAGRVPSGGEIWLTDGLIYKFVLKDANDVLIATYDNITGINSNAVAYTNQQEIVTATAGQTVFNLGISYQVGTNSLSVFVDGVNQYGPGAQYAYTETDSDTVTFNAGLHVGAEVKFTTTQQQAAGAVDASQVSYDPPFTGSVVTNVEAKLAQYVSVKDFGAVGDGVADDTAAFALALATSFAVYVPNGTYSLATWVAYSGSNNVILFGDNSAEIVGPGYGSTDPVLIASSASIEIKNLKVNNFRSLIGSLPTTLEDQLVVDGCVLSEMEYGIDLNATAAGGYRHIFVKNNQFSNMALGAWLTCQQMYDTQVVDNTFTNFSDSYTTGPDVQAVMIGLDTYPGTRKNAVVSSNIFTGIINTSGGGECTAIMVHECNSYTITGNVIKNVSGGAGEGIYTRDGYGVVDGNTIVDCESFGITGKRGNVTISNNRIYGDALVPGFGIGQVEWNNCNIVGNHISNVYCGISTEQTTTAAAAESMTYRVNISGNLIENVQRAGIYQRVRKWGSTITNNVIKKVVNGPAVPAWDAIGLNSNYGVGIHIFGISTASRRHAIKGNSIVNVAAVGGRDSVAMILEHDVSWSELFVRQNLIDQVDYGFVPIAPNPSFPYIIDNELYCGTAVYDTSLGTFGPGALLQESTEQLYTFVTNYAGLGGDPAGVNDGAVYYNNATHKLRLLANGTWVDLN